MSKAKSLLNAAHTGFQKVCVWGRLGGGGGGRFGGGGGIVSDNFLQNS